MPVVVACLVPAAPVLLPVLTGARVPEVEPVRVAVSRALTGLAGCDRVVVVADEVPGTLAGFGARPWEDPAGGGAPGYDEGPVPGGSWPHELALALLGRLAGAPPRRSRRSWDDPHLAELLGPDDGRRTGLLLLADGSRTRGERAPGGDDPRGAVVDAELAAALRAGRVAVAPDAEAVGATARAAVDLLARLPGRTELLHEAAPLGACYLVAARPDVRPVTGPVLVVVGATATGKSDLAVDLALRLGGEVVNADSMQLYRGMDIGTAKIGQADRRGVPHHLLDVWPVSRAAAVAEYQQLARERFTEVAGRGALPVLVGGSGLYVRAALDDLRFPGTDPAVRARWQAEADRVGPAALHARLHEVDPAAAAAVLPSNTRRVVRALEVVELTGRPFSASMPEAGPASRVVPAVVVGLRRPRPVLDRRVEERVAAMWRLGLVEEVERLLPEGLEQGATASRAVGYAQVLDLLRGRCTEAEAVSRTVTATRRLVRRQESWFGADPDVVWFDAGQPDTLGHVMAHVRERMGA